MNTYYCPRLEIIPYSYSHSHNYSDNFGRIKFELEYQDLIPNLFKNEKCVEYFTQNNLSYLPLKDYYSNNIKQKFDLYGGQIIKTIESEKFIIRLYFYSLKNPELITKDLISEHKTIFEQANYNNTNLLYPDYHNYRMKKFAQQIENKFLEIEFTQPFWCKTKLYLYQLHNITKMLKIHKGIKLQISDNIVIKFDLNIIYDTVANKFIEQKDIPEYTLKSGIIMDEPGVGKTLQIIVFLIELLLSDEFKDKRALILVPDNLKSHWIGEFKLHTNYNLSELPIDIVTFKEAEINIHTDKLFFEKYAINVYDELHIIYRSYPRMFDTLVSSKIPHKWGITSTPFIKDNSMWQILNLLIGKRFQNERIGYIPEVQNELAKVFLKNTKHNTLKEHSWPEIILNNNILELDLIQQAAYDTEAISLTSVDKLMELASDISIRFDNTNIQTPKELKQSINAYYKAEYEKELDEMKIIDSKIKNLDENKDKLDIGQYIERRVKLEQLLHKKVNEVKVKKTAYEYFMNSMNIIIQITENKDNIDCDEVCAICLNTHEIPITYIKKCSHFYCKMCFDQINSNSCPMCKGQFIKSDLVIVQDKVDILLNSKYTKIYELLNSTEDKFIIFTQYSKIINNIVKFLKKYNIDCSTYSEYIQLTKEEQDNLKVVILSSEDSSSGLDFSSKNRVIIYEPFEDHLYSREIEKQLIGRVHRLRQTKTVYVDRLIMDKTIEKDIYSKYE